MASRHSGKGTMCTSADSPGSRATVRIRNCSRRTATRIASQSTMREKMHIPRGVKSSSVCVHGQLAAGRYTSGVHRFFSGKQGTRASSSNRLLTRLGIWCPLRRLLCCPFWWIPGHRVSCKTWCHVWTSIQWRKGACHTVLPSSTTCELVPSIHYQN